MRGGEILLLLRKGCLDTQRHLRTRMHSAASPHPPSFLDPKLRGGTGGGTGSGTGGGTGGGGKLLICEAVLQTWGGGENAFVFGIKHKGRDYSVPELYY